MTRFRLKAVNLAAFCVLLASAVNALPAGAEYVKPEGKGLRDLAAARGKHFGGNFTLLTCGGHKDPPAPWATAKHWEESFQDWKAIAKDHFTILSAGWQMYPGHSWLAPDEYCLEGADRIIAWCRKHGIAFHGHGLGYIQRGWPAKVEIDSEDDARKFRQTYEKYVRTFATHYKGRIAIWDVCNEHLRYGSYFGTWSRFNKFKYLKAYGASDEQPVYGLDWYVKTFTLAHDSDPEARLIYLDYCNEIVCDKSNVMYEVARTLKKRGVPIHSVGFQLHQGTNFNRVLAKDPALFGAKEQKPKTWHTLSDARFLDSMRENCRRFADLGLDLWATEVDVNIRDVFDNETDAFKRQAWVYRKLVEVMLEFESYRGFKTWGVTDSEKSRAYLFDAKGRAKPAFYAVRDAFEHYHPKVIAAHSFDSGEPHEGDGWSGPWTLDGAAIHPEKGFTGEHCLVLTKAGDTAARSVALQGTYNAHLSYRWLLEGLPYDRPAGETLDEARFDRDILVVEASSDGGTWQPMRTYNRQELVYRLVEVSPWHAGCTTLVGMDGKEDVRIRFRALDGMNGHEFLLDGVQVIADDASDNER